MTEIPEHLLKRAQAAREKAEAEAAPAAAPAAADAAPEAAADPRIPAHLLERSRAAKAKTEGGAERADGAGGGGLAVAEKVARGRVARPPPVVACPSVPVPAGTPSDCSRSSRADRSKRSRRHRSTRCTPGRTCSIGEFVAALACTAFTFVFSVFVNAPLLRYANINQTPNPSKAPWYFLGLQELLTMFHPMIAGVTIPASA